MPRTKSPNVFAILGLLLMGLGMIVGCQSFHGYVECQPTPVLQDDFRIFSHPQLTTRMPRRVLLIHSGFASSSNETVDTFANSLADNLKSDGLFEVVTPAIRCQTTIDEILAGRFNEREIIDLAHRYNVDGIMLFRINSFKFHSPMSINVSVGMVDPNEAIVLFAADGVWDLADRSTSDNFRAYLCSRLRRSQSSQLNIHQNSPQSFFGYVSWQVARSLSSRIQ